MSVGIPLCAHGCCSARGLSLAGFTIIAIGCGIIAYLLVHESRAWRQLVWDVLHATGIADTQHKTLRDLVRLSNLRRRILSQHASNFSAALRHQAPGNLKHHMYPCQAVSKQH